MRGEEKRGVEGVESDELILADLSKKSLRWSISKNNGSALFMWKPARSSKRTHCVDFTSYKRKQSGFPAFLSPFLSLYEKMKMIDCC